MTLLRLIHHEQHLETTTQFLSRGSLASELDKDTIRRFFVVRMGREALTNTSLICNSSLKATKL
jgi:hypothetical protein